MTEITLYNTRTRQKERFVPLDVADVRIYVCGPTVYDRAHIGNSRPVVVFDVLYRLLRHVYGASHVTYVRNITDIDDKIIARAAETGRPIDEITEETVRWYREDMAALGVLAPSAEPRATEFVWAMIAMIETLIARGNAYVADGHVLFAVASYPDYGRFAHRSLDEMQAGARVEVAPYKRDPMDFVLWKPSAPDLPGWESPWGRGRPGWHIECSAMSYELLGPSFDIHGGGIDLVFPHHENEIAQSRCAHPEGIFANLWMHNGFLNVEGEKMSKSLGNFFTVWDLRQRMSGDVIRHLLLSSHYRAPLDWTEQRVAESKSVMNRWTNLFGRARRAGIDADEREPIDSGLLGFLADDLNTPGAMQRVHELARAAEADRHALKTFLRSTKFLGFDPKGIVADAGESIEKATDLVRQAEARLNAAVAEIQAARLRKDFVAADRIRAELEALGVSIQSTRDGTTWSRTVEFDPAKVVAGP